MRPDPPIDEIRAVRHAISESCGHDPKRLVERYLELQRRHAHRLVSSPAQAAPEAQADLESRPTEPRSR